jgi:hypothetical protein
MRTLMGQELAFVSGGGGSSRCDCHCDDRKHKNRKQKGNNGFGNGGRDGVPGNSGKQDRTR